MYDINKQLVIDVFKVCAKGYVDESKGQVDKSLVAPTLQNCRLALANSFIN